MLKLRTRRVPVDPIVVEVPAAFKAASQRCARLFELAESARQAAASGQPFAYAELERAFVLGVQAVQCELHAAVLGAMGCEDPRRVYGSPGGAIPWGDPTATRLYRTSLA